MSAVSVEAYNERQQRAVGRLLDLLERSTLRTDQHYSRVRRHERKTFRGVLSLFVPTPEITDPEQPEAEICTVWSYSLSQGGVGFIAPQQLAAEEVSIGIHLPAGRTRWLRGRVVRCREIPDEQFFDYGVAFHAAHSEPAK
jgi:hypothetical protein